MSANTTPTADARLHKQKEQRINRERSRLRIAADRREARLRAAQTAYSKAVSHANRDFAQAVDKANETMSMTAIADAVGMHRTNVHDIVRKGNGSATPSS